LKFNSNWNGEEINATGTSLVSQQIKFNPGTGSAFYATETATPWQFAELAGHHMP